MYFALISFHCRYAPSVLSPIVLKDLETYALVYFIPDPIRDSIVRPVISISIPSSTSTPGVERIHFKAKCRSEHNAEEDEISAEEETIYPELV